MHRIAFTVALLVGWFVTVAALAAEPLVVDLWPGKTPGDVGIPGQETRRIHPSPLAGPTRLITNVTRPTLTVYRPAADQNTGTAMVICPGGGYWDLSRELEGEEVATWLSAQGMTGIILKYRCPRLPEDVRGEPPLGPQLDAQMAVRLVRSRSAEWGIDPRRIGMVGFSAGGHLAPATATGFSERLYEPIDAVDEVSCRPDFAVLCYSGDLKAKDKDEISAGIQIPAGTPPVLLAHASDDRESYGGPDAANGAVMYLALKRAGVPAELHVYATGDHDFGVRQDEKLPSSWTRLCVNWLRSQGLLKSGSDRRDDDPGPPVLRPLPVRDPPGAALGDGLGADFGVRRIHELLPVPGFRLPRPVACVRHGRPAPVPRDGRPCGPGGGGSPRDA
ncbi:MAG TPA: alpha/beta hydrolase, partial [Isosphaeraceae bacterium]